MPALPQVLHRLLARPVRAVQRRFAERGYRRALRQGQAAGVYLYRFDSSGGRGNAGIEVRLRADACTPAAAKRWCAQQTLVELQVVALEDNSQVAWRVDAGGPVDAAEALPARWFLAPGELPDFYPAHLESAWLVAAGEVLDAVILGERLELPEAGEISAITSPALRQVSLLRAAAWAYQPHSDQLRATAERLLIKQIGAAGVGAESRHAECWTTTRRGPYLSSYDLGPVLEVGVRDAASAPRRQQSFTKPVLLVSNCFLARGGAEHTLFETLRALRQRFEIAIVTLAPHRPELGDRREDFRHITERIYCLGDLVHPAAMYGMLLSLIDSLGVEVLYNANGTTLFYEYAPRLKADRPGLRILDHLYDHLHGYIEHYSPALLAAVDACVAENRRIAETLAAEHSWPRQRAPVIWPCGRRRDAFPSSGQTAAIRRRIRQQLKVADDDLLFLTAARMHPQKRPIDLVHLARRVRDLRQVHFLLVGGGELADQVDREISKDPGINFRRLPFRHDIPELIVAADVGCLVSEYEGLPVFMLECLQAGRPFLGTDVGEMGYVLRTTGAGLVTDQPGDLASLEAHVRNLCDPELWSELAQKAMVAGHRFDVEHCAERYAAVFLGQDLAPEEI